jgi:hypothetical protein
MNETDPFGAWGAIKYGSRQVSQGDWVLQTWLHGSLGSRGMDLPVFLELCNTGKDRLETPCRIRLKVVLTELHGDGIVRQEEFEPSFTRWQKRQDKKSCWRAIIQDSLKSDWTQPNTTPLPVGDHLLKISVTISDGAPVLLDAIPMKTVDRAKGR